VDTLAVRLTVPPVGPADELHLQVNAPCRAHKSKKYAGKGILLINAGVLQSKGDIDSDERARASIVASI